MTDQTVKHTPGPWQVSHRWQVDGTSVVVAVGGGPATMIAVVSDGVGMAEADDNARLIAAAPEMAEALRALIASDVTPPTPSDYATRGYRSFTPEQGRLIDRQNDARALLARIEGEDPLHDPDASKRTGYERGPDGFARKIQPWPSIERYKKAQKDL